MTPLTTLKIAQLRHPGRVATVKSVKPGLAAVEGVTDVLDKGFHVWDVRRYPRRIV